MGNERGAAIAIVLLILGVVSLVAAGLLVQRRFDNYFNVAQANYERMFNLADGAASLAFTQVGVKESVQFSGGQGTELVFSSKKETGFDETHAGTWESRVTLKGYETDPRLLSGWELGTAEGYHVQFWMAQGTGNTAVNLRSFKAGGTEETNWRDVHPLPSIAVFIAASKFARNL